MFVIILHHTDISRSMLYMDNLILSLVFFYFFYFAVQYTGNWNKSIMMCQTTLQSTSTADDVQQTTVLTALSYFNTKITKEGATTAQKV